MTARLAAAVVTSLLCGTAFAQPGLTSLSRQQKSQLESLIIAVDHAATGTPPSTTDAWLTHVLRASDGSHYIAFSFTPPQDELADRAVVMYVRLSTANVPGEITITERSVVREWLQGSRIDPRLLPRRGMAIGEMPPMGAGAIGARGAGSVGSSDLQAMGLERERSRQRREDDERQRSKELEGATVTPTDRFPFEDFEIGPAATFANGTRAIQRALTAGPGAYDLSVAWVDASLPPGKAPVHVARRSLRLAPAASEFGLSSVIVADRIGVRGVPFSPVEQRAHPYAIGPTEIVPAPDLAFTPAERLSIAFQIFNATPSAAGKPDVIVNPRMVRLTGMREEPVASLSPLTYNAASMPADFDLRLGHPIIAALAAPLSTLRRGDYKLVITAEDRQAGVVASTTTGFTVLTTAAGLLAEAPPLAQRMEPATMLSPATVTQVLDALAVTTSSPALQRALASARAGRFADLFIEEPVPEVERGVRAALSGMALLSIGDLGALAMIQRAEQAGTPPAAIHYLLGVALAIQRRDADALTAFEKARAEGLPSSVTAPLIAHLRLLRGDAPGAAAAIAARDVPTGQTLALKVLAMTRIAAQREREAISVLDMFLADNAGDLDARFLLVRALYAELVRGIGEHARFSTEAQRYVDAGGAHAALVRDWMVISF